MSVLLIAETNAGELAVDATAKTVQAATSLGDITAVVFGTNDAAAQAAKISGISKILLIDEASTQNGLAENIAASLQEIASNTDGQFTHIVAPATASGKNILPRLAALLDVMIMTDVLEIVDAETFKRPVYAGNAIQTVKSSDPIKVITIRTSAFEAVEMNGDASINTVQATDLEISAHINDTMVESDRPELTAAGVVVSGGRGVGSEENFALIETLAEKLGAAVGASRAAVDSGYAPNDWQVGQTGKIVAPELYIAVGISGAIQHLAGMKDSKIIVAINKDEEAPIFQVADYGLVADLFDAVPELQSKL